MQIFRMVGLDYEIDMIAIVDMRCFHPHNMLCDMIEYQQCPRVALASGNRYHRDVLEIVSSDSGILSTLLLYSNENEDFQVAGSSEPAVLDLLHRHQQFLTGPRNSIDSDLIILVRLVFMFYQLASSTLPDP